MANPKWVDTFSQADLDLLVHKREVERKQFPTIGLEMNRPWKTCFDRYTKIVRLRERDEDITIVPAIVAGPPSLHSELGIETFTHMQAVLHSPGGKYSRGIKGEQVNAHWYRMPVTLAKVWA